MLMAQMIKSKDTVQILGYLVIYYMGMGSNVCRPFKFQSAILYHTTDMLQLL